MIKMLMFAAAAVGAAVPASAQEAPVSIKVRYADLNLASPQGVTALNQRIKAAARQVCGPQPTNLDETMAMRRCQTDAIRSAEPQVALAMGRASPDSVVVAASR